MLKIKYNIFKPANEITLPYMKVVASADSVILGFNPEFTGKIEMPFEEVILQEVPCFPKGIEPYSGCHGYMYHGDCYTNGYTAQTLYILEWLKNNNTRKLDELRNHGVILKPELSLRKLVSTYTGDRSNWRDDWGVGYDNQYSLHFYLLPTEKNIELAKKGVRMLVAKLEEAFIEAYKSEKIDIKGEIKASEEVRKNLAPESFKSLFEKGEK